MTWLRWLWAVIGVVGAAALAIFTLGRRPAGVTTAIADEKRARAAHRRVKERSEAAKVHEARSTEAAERHLHRAAVHGARAADLEEESRAIAERAAAQMPLGRRLDRFNARHGLTGRRDQRG